VFNLLDILLVLWYDLYMRKLQYSTPFDNLSDGQIVQVQRGTQHSASQYAYALRNLFKEDGNGLDAFSRGNTVYVFKNPIDMNQ